MTASYLSPTFIIGNIRIGSIEGASCLNMGNNWPIGFESHKKHNQGFGTVGGDRNQIHGARNVLNDADLLDMFTQADGNEIPDWVKEMIIETSREAQATGMND